MNDSHMQRFEELKRKQLEDKLGCKLSKYTSEEWLNKAIESEDQAMLSDDQEYWLETSRLQLKAASMLCGKV